MTGNGYAGEILVVDLATQKVSTLATVDYAGRFLAVKGSPPGFTGRWCRHKRKLLIPGTALYASVVPLPVLADLPVTAG